MRVQDLASWRGVLTVWGPIAGIAALHYGAPAELHWVHDVARRLFYVPILLAGARGGRMGGLLAAAVTIAIYVPHAFTGHAAHMDPATPTEKGLEMAFYVVMGLLSGHVAQRDSANRQALSHKDDQLVRAARLQALGQLSAGLAHEIRNPLHAMRGTAEIVLDAVPPDAPEHALGQAHIQEIDRLSGVLDRFLSFARDQGAPDRTPMDLDPVLERVATLVRAQAGRQDARVVLDLHGGTVVADAEQLTQVVLALALNGLQAMPPSGTLTLSSQGTRLVVHNQGPAIPEADLQRVFDPFFTTRENGTGLGLSVAWRIAERHGATLQVENTDGGVAFSLDLPPA